MGERCTLMNGLIEKITGKKVKKKTVFLLLLVSIAVISIAAGRKKTIDLDKYVSAEFSGYDGYGTANVTFDRNSFCADHMNDVKFKSKNAENLFRQSYGNSASSPVAALYVYLLIESLPGSLAKLDKEHQLQNGEKVSLAWTFDEDRIGKFFKCKLKYTDKKYTVEGLADPTIFDPFENLKVVFAGGPGEGIATIDDGYYTVSNYSYGEYRINPNRNLWNGDTVTVTYEVSEDQVTREGFIPSRTSIDFCVDGVDYYARSVEEACKEFGRKQKDAVNEAYRYTYWETSDFAKCTMAKYYYLIPENERDNHYLFGAVQVEFTKTPLPLFYYVFGKENIIVDGSGRQGGSDYSEKDVKLEHEITRTFGSYLGDNPTRSLSGFDTLDELRDFLEEKYPGYKVEEKSVG